MPLLLCPVGWTFASLNMIRASMLFANLFVILNGVYWWTITLTPERLNIVTRFVTACLNVAGGTAGIDTADIASSGPLGKRRQKVHLNRGALGPKNLEINDSTGAFVHPTGGYDTDAGSVSLVMNFLAHEPRETVKATHGESGIFAATAYSE